MSESIEWQSSQGGIRQAGEKQKSWWRKLEMKGISVRAANLIRLTNLDSDESLKKAIEKNLLDKFSGAGKKTIQELAEYSGAVLRQKKATETQIKHAIALLERSGYTVTKKTTENIEARQNGKQVSTKASNDSIMKKRNILITLAWVNGLSYTGIGKHMSLSSARCRDIVLKTIRAYWRISDTAEEFKGIDHDLNAGKLIPSLKNDYIRKIKFLADRWGIDMVSINSELEPILAARTS